MKISWKDYVKIEAVLETVGVVKNIKETRKM